MPSAWSKVLANIAMSLTAGQAGAPPLIAGTGKDEVHLLVVCTGERGLAGAFNTAIGRLARDDARRLMADGKTVKFFVVGRKGYDILRREYSDRRSPSASISASCRQITFAEAKKVASRIIEMFEEGAFDVATLYYSRFQSVISQVPTAQRIIPAEVPEDGNAHDPSEARSTNTSRTRRRSSPSSCRAMSASRFSGRCWRTPPPSTARR